MPSPLRPTSTSAEFLDFRFLLKNKIPAPKILQARAAIPKATPMMRGRDWLEWAELTGEELARDFEKDLVGSEVEDEKTLVLMLESSVVGLNTPVEFVVP